MDTPNAEPVNAALIQISEQAVTIPHDYITVKKAAKDAKLSTARIRQMLAADPPQLVGVKVHPRLWMVCPKSVKAYCPKAVGRQPTYGSKKAAASTPREREDDACR